MAGQFPPEPSAAARLRTDDLRVYAMEHGEP